MLRLLIKIFFLNKTKLGDIAHGTEIYRPEQTGHPTCLKAGTGFVFPMREMVQRIHYFLGDVCILSLLERPPEVREHPHSKVRCSWAAQVGSIVKRIQRIPLLCALGSMDEPLQPDSSFPLPIFHGMVLKKFSLKKLIQVKGLLFPLI